MKRVLSIGLFVLLVMALLPAQPLRAGGWSVLGTHIVRRSETLFCIGRAYGVDPWAIAAHNGILNPNLVRVGTPLAIPNAPATLPPGPVCARQFPSTPVYPPACGGCACRYRHMIVTGETLTRISIRYGVDMWAIAACNCIYNLNYIRVGDWLCIP